MSWPTPGATHLIDAMVHVEGGEDAFVRAVRCSMACSDYAEARTVAANTIAHALWDYICENPRVVAALNEQNFVQFLGARWAPIGVANDPTNLNKNWVPNVMEFLRLSAPSP